MTALRQRKSMEERRDSLQPLLLPPQSASKNNMNINNNNALSASSATAASSTSSAISSTPSSSTITPSAAAVILPNMASAVIVLPIAYYLVSVFTTMLAPSSTPNNDDDADDDGTDDGYSVFRSATAFHFALALITFIATSFVAAPYGSRLVHSKDTSPFLAFLCKWNVSSTYAWIFQEVPTLMAFVFFVLVVLCPSSNAGAADSGAVAASATVATAAFHPTMLLFLIHYIQRTLIFPWFIVNGRGWWFWREGQGGQSASSPPPPPPRHNPLLTVLLATCYCAFNGALQVRANTRAIIAGGGGGGGAAAAKAAVVHVVKGEGRLSSFLDEVFGNFFGFNALLGNASFNSPIGPSSSLPPRWGVLLFFFGSLIFFTGMWVNVTSDYYLFNIARQRAEKAKKNEKEKTKKNVTDGSGHGGGSGDYVIPSTFWFRLVTAPNYLGELIEWSGYCIALLGVHLTSSSAAADDVSSSSSSTTTFITPFLAGVSFWFYTFSNLGPRAMESRRWYIRTFNRQGDANINDPSPPKYRVRWALFPYLW